MVCNELWAYDISAKSWENVTVNTGSCESTLMHIGFTNQDLCGPLRSAGHTATLVPSSIVSQSTSSGSGGKLVTERMIVLFGHSPTYGFLNFVQEYYFGLLFTHITHIECVYCCCTYIYILFHRHKRMGSCKDQRLSSERWLWS